ncbi:hypothetical protein DL96DRAFT_1683392 [Flagelloscypha sp. PMI_526]|nr:hypothetical protein DL96DRAFT_1683392 [Flagelloscypha sp. PMI_526]
MSTTISSPLGPVTVTQSAGDLTTVGPLSAPTSTVSNGNIITTKVTLVSTVLNTPTAAMPAASSDSRHVSAPLNSLTIAGVLIIILAFVSIMLFLVVLIIRRRRGQQRAQRIKDVERQQATRAAFMPPYKSYFPEY